MAKPIIGITLDSQEAGGYSDFPWYALRRNYSEAVAAAGAVPVLISFETNIREDILNLIDGLVITGGDFDVPPAYYGQEINHESVHVNLDRSDCERQLVLAALEKNMPFLGICNGMQILNVALGGSLIQHIPAFRPSEINHEQPKPKNIPTHDIEILPNTKLAAIASGKTNFRVNTTHHQAIDQLGNNLLIAAAAPDGIIEAIEHSEKDFVIGVEWHPEYLETKGLDSELFSTFIEHAKKYKKQKHKSCELT